MKKKISRGCAVLLACAMLAGLLMTTAFARASDYLAIIQCVGIGKTRWCCPNSCGCGGDPYL